MSIFTDPHKVLANIWESITGTGSDVYEFLKPVIAMLKKDGKKALIAAATAAVAQASTMDLSNGDKRDAALQIIEKSVVAAGATFFESEARAALEMALQGLKAKAEA